MHQLSSSAAAPPAVDMASDDWYRDAVLYQIYPRSFADADGDGVGDLRGVIEHLPHLAWLGVDGIWLSPINVSPNADYGYDVADYYDVDPSLGTLADVDELVAKAGTLGIKVLLDLVPNHTSDQCAWFQEAASSRESPRRDWYVWADPKPDGPPANGDGPGGLPNNWMSMFGGPAWTWHEPTGQYYLHNFLPEQPDLNWWNQEVRDEFDRILEFWFERGIAGFRIDVCHGIVKDRLLRDDLPMPPGRRQHRPWDLLRVHSFNQPEVHDVLKGWRALANRFSPAAVLVGETWAEDLPALMRFYGDGDELQLAFNFEFTMSRMEAPLLRRHVADTERQLPPGGWPVWTLSNHDIARFTTRWADSDPARARAGLFVLLTLRGTPVLYYGDEIGMTNGVVPPERVHDMRRFLDSAENHPTRDPVRTPMQWDGSPEAGFTSAGTEPWLPIHDAADTNVADQRDDPASMLTLCRQLIAARREHAELRSGAYAELDAPDGVWAWRRGDGIVVAVNLSDVPVTLSLPGGGEVIAATSPARAGARERIDTRLELAPWEGLLLAVSGA